MVSFKRAIIGNLCLLACLPFGVVRADDTAGISAGSGIEPGQPWVDDGTNTFTVGTGDVDIRDASPSACLNPDTGNSWCWHLDPGGSPFWLANGSDRPMLFDQNNNLYLSSLLSCDTIDTNSQGRLICGTDAGSESLVSDTTLGNGTASSFVFSSNLSGTNDPTLTFQNARLVTDRALTVSGTGITGSTSVLTAGILTVNGNGLGVNDATPDVDLEVVDSFFVSATSGGDGNLFEVTSAGAVGILTNTQSFSLSFGGNAARNIGLERHTTANTAGNTLTMSGGGATSGATDKNGGNLLLNPGVSTGSGTANVVIGAYPGVAASTTDNSLSTIVTVSSTGVAVTGALSVTTDLTSSDSDDIGWSIVDGTDNTAGTAQCTSACVFGIQNATGTAVTNLVSCADTTADLAVCAGAS